MDNRSFTALLERGLRAHQAGRFDEALDRYRAALAAFPDDAEALSLAGLAQVHLDQAAQGLPQLLRAVALEPNQPGFRLNLAEGLASAGRNDEALSALRDVASAEPDNVRAWERMGDLCERLGDDAQAAAALRRAHSLAPHSAPVAIKFARLEWVHGRHEAALQIIDAAMTATPDHAELFAVRSDVLIDRRDWPGLLTNATAWTGSHPQNIAAWRSFARAAFELGRFVQACDAFAHVLSLAPPSAADFTAHAGLCLHALDMDAAAAALERAEALDAEHPPMLAARALLLMYLGSFEAAEAYGRRCLERDPQHAAVYTTLSRLRGGRLLEDELTAVAQIARTQAFALDHRIPAAFAVAHAHDAREQIDVAVAAYEYAHSLALARDRAEGRSHDPEQHEARSTHVLALAAASAHWPAPPVAQAADPRALRPIFIVGMPRSGTTLMESVLAAHSHVFACGERPVMPQILRAALALAAAKRSPDAQILQDWARAYVRELPTAQAVQRATDKHPLNFEAAALIVRLFPQATIIHARRNPVETCLSIWRQEFNKQWTFTHRLADIAHYYGCYARLAAHWERTLPRQFITVQYEDFVREFEAAAPALVRACGLEWEPSCAEFQQAPRAIATFSAVQARGPVRLGAARAQRYEKHLGPLLAGLERAGVDLDTGALR